MEHNKRKYSSYHQLDNSFPVVQGIVPIVSYRQFRHSRSHWIGRSVQGDSIPPDWRKGLKLRLASCIAELYKNELHQTYANQSSHTHFAV
jgi:hypothetical protein